MGSPPLDRAQLARSLVDYLALAGPTGAAEARRHLGVSQPTFSRVVAVCREELLVLGAARATRYAARRLIDGVGREVRIYEILRDGRSRVLGTLHGIWPAGFYFESASPDAASAVFDDLPYFLYDLRPAGFLGRLIPRRHPELPVPEDIRQWSAEHCLRYLVRYGWNHVGNLIVGDEAFQLHMRHVQSPADQVPCSQRATEYPRLASEVLAAGEPGSSAAGEQPKFLATRVPDPTPVLVKFSPPVRDELSRRVADLLWCEQLAHETLREYGQPAARSEVLEAGERTFLEVERFDRVGACGRLGTISLLPLDAELVGRLVRWSDSAAALAAAKVIDAETLLRVRWLELFGRLIGNSDMHLGNLSFFTEGTRVASLCPAYDMTPMQYAPRHNQLPETRFAPPLPSPADADIWPEVWRAARSFWNAVGTCQGVSESFRRVASENAASLEPLGALIEMLPQPASA